MAAASNTELKKGLYVVDRKNKRIRGMLRHKRWQVSLSLSLYKGCLIIYIWKCFKNSTIPKISCQINRVLTLTTWLLWRLKNILCAQSANHQISSTRNEIVHHFSELIHFNFACFISWFTPLIDLSGCWVIKWYQSLFKPRSVTQGLQHNLQGVGGGGRNVFQFAARVSIIGPSVVFFERLGQGWTGVITPHQTV